MTRKSIIALVLCFVVAGIIVIFIGMAFWNIAQEQKAAGTVTSGASMTQTVGSSLLKDACMVDGNI